MQCNWPVANHMNPKDLLSQRGLRKYIPNYNRFRLRCVCTLTATNLRGKGGVPGGQIMENEFEYLTDRGGYGDHLAEKFLKKYCS